MKKKSHIIIIALILIAIIISITIFILNSTNSTATYLNDSVTTLTKATDTLVEIENNTTLSNDNNLNYNQGACYQYGQQFENIWNSYNDNYKNSSNIKYYYNEIQSIESQEKLAYGLLTNGVTLYLNGSSEDKQLGVDHLKRAYSIINKLNNETVPNTINNFKEEINKLQK